MATKKQLTPASQRCSKEQIQMLERRVSAHVEALRSAYRSPPKPKEVVAAERTVAQWEKHIDDLQQRARGERTALKTKVLDIVYFSHPDQAVAAVQRLEAGLLK